MVAAVNIAAWPRGLSAQEAARYVGVTEPTFRKLVAKGLLPEGVRLSPDINRVVWDKRQVDEAFSKISGLSGTDSPSTDEEWEKWQVL